MKNTKGTQRKTSTVAGFVNDKKAFLYADEKEVFIQGTPEHFEKFFEGVAFSCTRAMLSYISATDIKEMILKAVEKGIDDGEKAFLSGDFS